MLALSLLASNLFQCTFFEQHSLIYRNPYDPFSEEERKLEKKQLPRIAYPGCTLLRINDSSFAVIFGGYNAVSEKLNTDTIIVDLEKCYWWTLRIKGTSASPRINPAMVAIDSKIYIFGGYRQFGVDPRPYNSFSIAEYDPERGTWTWVTRDEPYSAPVPAGHVFGQACAVYNGAKILLTPGRLTDSKVSNCSHGTE